MSDLLSLARRMDRLNSNIKSAASDAAVSVATAIITDLAYVTPVDTSRALSSWHINFVAPDDIRGKAHRPGRFGSTKSASAKITVALAVKMLRGKKPGQAIYIVNNQPYIRMLNYGGHSKQVAAGFVYRAAMIGRKLAASTKLKIKG